MHKITTDLTINFTKHLKVLYVEDDLNLQRETQEFLELLFDVVTVASNGEEALQKYKLNSFDIVISDVKMPKMNGVKLSTEIKELNPEQNIIIVSAYNDSEYLLKFISLNIRYFIQKPLNIENILDALYHTSKSIVNAKMVEEYRESLEHSNKELHEKNTELERLVRILDSKLLQIGKVNKIDIQEKDLTNAAIDIQDLNELKELETDISGAAILVSLAKNINISNIHVLGDLFTQYADIVSKYPSYEDLSLSIKELGSVLKSEAQNFIDRIDDISTLLESFIYVLRMWREKITNAEFTHALEFHSSMINDLQTIISIVHGTEDEIQSDMEFF